MYKALNTKKYYLAINTFPKTAKNPPLNEVYKTGIHKWEADDSTNYSIVIGTFRIIFAINKPQYGECNG